MLNVIGEFGFASLGLKKEDFLSDNYVTQLGYPPLRIDILKPIIHYLPNHNLSVIASRN